MDKGAGKEEASVSDMQPQGAGGVTGGARWGRAETAGRSRMLRVGRKRGGEEKKMEEGRGSRRRGYERWSRMEGGEVTLLLRLLSSSSWVALSCHHLTS